MILSRLLCCGIVWHFEYSLCLRPMLCYYRMTMRVIRILVSHLYDLALSRHQHTHVVELAEHTQRTVGQHHLVWRHLRRKRKFKSSSKAYITKLVSI